MLVIQTLLFFWFYYPRIKNSNDFAIMLATAVILSFIWQVHSFIDLTGHRLYHLMPTTQEELELMRELDISDKYDLWTYPSVIYEKVNVRVPPTHADSLEKQFESLGLEYKVVIDNIQKWIDKERSDNPFEDETAAQEDDMQIGVYHSFEFISAYLDELAIQYPYIASIEVLGTTHEGNTIKGIKIGSVGNDKPAIWIDAAMHAREWISTATSLYIIDQLLNGYDYDDDIARLVDIFDWYIIPVVNVDGYKYTWTYDRMWRKNRVPSEREEDQNNPLCFGADPNRNFGAGFGGNGTSSNNCKGIYRGSGPFSEAESKAVRDGVLRLGSRLKAYFSLHSYSQRWMTPYGYTWKLPGDYEAQMIALDTAIVAVANTHGKWYKHGSIFKTIYAASGASADWVYEGAGVKYCFAVELRDTGDYGFLLPNTQIIPTGEETFAGIKSIAGIVEREYYDETDY